MKIESSAFKNNGELPSKYTCDGEGINPPLSFINVPKEAKSLALIVDDPDIPESVKQSFNIDVWDHWVIFNMSPEVKGIEENTIPAGILGRNTTGNDTYGSPCPPDREHRYFFKLYALDTLLNLQQGSTKKEVLKALEGHIIEEAELIGKYKRK
ncbi:MAG: YbhB/YbcL family Raf kinase inhibitor-like protein [Candidatus Paceibacterota bacterium]|jgi:hypothetical protein